MVVQSPLVNYVANAKFYMYNVGRMTMRPSMVNVHTPFTAVVNTSITDPEEVR